MAPREEVLALLSSGTTDSPRDGDSFAEGPAVLAATRHLLRPNGSIVGVEVSRALEPLYANFVAAIPASDRPALAAIDGRTPITHTQVSQFVWNDIGPVLQSLGVGRGHRVALVLPNGPELALAIVAVSHWASCVPLSATAPRSELESDVVLCGADVLIGPYSGAVHHHEERPLSGSSAGGMEKDPNERFRVLGNSRNDWSHFSWIEESAARLDMPFLGLVPSPREAGIFRLVVPQQLSQSTPLLYEDISSKACAKTILTRTDASDLTGNCLTDEALVLFTSGTTGNKKLVPHQLGDVLCSATIIALSWNLSPSDVNCNLMPLFHVGGIVRQVFSPLLSGGCVICCPSFDPSIFWALLAKGAFTWYYAAPTMHQIILQTHEPEICPSPALRMIANAAGGLLPSLAVQLRDKFRQAYILPSYGMTECMPISSPPSNYELNRPGTSGVAVGPEISVMDVGRAVPVPSGVEGAICVRGAPCFKGYSTSDPQASEAAVTASSFLPGGWFNTGDLGYLDGDGYLYITGRSKEVINRGGEIISPMEVEEAVMTHPDVASCAAFSAKHDVLQEVVGVALVMKTGRLRLDLTSLHKYLGERLAAPKWPQLIVFMDGVPKSHTNKLLRVKLGERFGLPEMNDAMLPAVRLFEALCPAQGAGLDVPIPATRCTVSASDSERKLKQALFDRSGIALTRDELLIREGSSCSGALVCYLYGMSRDAAVEAANCSLDAYAIPSHFVNLQRPITTYGDSLPTPSVEDSVGWILHSKVPKSTDPVIATLQDSFAQLLKLDFLPGVDANFFQLGGSSLLASQLASKIRRNFGVSCAGAEVFHYPSITDLTKLVHKRSSTSDDTTVTSDTTSTSASRGDSQSADDQGAPFSSKRLQLECSIWASLLQLLPMFVIYPLFQVTRYMLFFFVLLWSVEMIPGERDLFTFVLAYLSFHLCWITVTPLVFVAIKWMVIGRYAEGRFPIWGTYYIKWWIVDVCRKLFLRGIWGSNETFLNCYYRMLGADIGDGARISLEADVAEYDLVSVGRNAAVEMSTLRGFGVDNGAFILGRVRVGNDASIGVRSVVAPFTSVPDNSHLGPLSTSYDAKAIHEKHARVNRRCLPEPSIWIQLFVAAPIVFFVNCIGQIPPLIMLWCMLRYKVDVGEEFQTPSDLMRWLCDPRRIPFYLGIRVARALLSPLFYMMGAIAVKRFVIRKFQPGPSPSTSQWQLLRHHLAATLLCRKKIQNVVDIIGRHYELVSCLYRLLGAKVGKRVFWPGHQPVFSGEFDLLEIGDDVVFGSRSFIICRSIEKCEKVILCAGANVADNCLVLPGCIVGKNAVLGSNSVCPEGWRLSPGSVWFGSKGSEPICLEKGPESCLGSDAWTSEMEGDDTTLRPFGRAFYKREASYCVWPLSLILTATITVKSFIAIFHAMPLLASLQGASLWLFDGMIHERGYVPKPYGFWAIYITVHHVFFWVNVLRVFIWFCIEVCAKHFVVGRRQEGRFNYDTTDYAQRWELYQLISKIRRFSRFNFLDFFAGTPYMATYVRALGGSVGKNCVLYPSGADPYMPEPDLVVLGDRCVIDCASLVAHLNTRGNFELAKIVVENDCTLRRYSRLQQGVYMEAGSQMLEKSVAMTGEIIESKSVWLGCPASPWFQLSDLSIVRGLSDESLDALPVETSHLLPRIPTGYSA